MANRSKAAIGAAFTGALMLTLLGGVTHAADYGGPPAGAGVDGFAYSQYGYTGHGYTPYGYGGYIGPYYRVVCYGDWYDCGPLQHGYGRYHSRPVSYAR